MSWCWYTCGTGFYGQRRTKRCLDIQLRLPPHGRVLKINSAPISSVIRGFLAIDCALLGSPPISNLAPEKRQALSMEALRARACTFVSVHANCLCDAVPGRHTDSRTAWHIANVKLMLLFLKANSCCNSYRKSMFTFMAFDSLI